MNRDEMSERRDSLQSAEGVHRPLGRRALLRAGAVIGVAAGTSGLLAACTGGGGSAGGGTGAGKPKVGGTLKVGMAGGSISETLEAHLATGAVDMARTNALYSNLIRTGRDGRTPELALAKSMTSNDDATEWTIVLKDGPTFHDGRPVTADDVVFSFKRIMDNDFPGKAGLGSIDLNRTKAVDPRTVKVVFKEPFAIFMEIAATFEYNLYIVPTDYDPKKPVGSGPFKFESFEPGSQSVFARNENYWESGTGPYANKLVIAGYQDETAQINALSSGQVDMINGLSRASGQVKSAGGRFQISAGGAMSPFVMNVKQDPWNDERVRQALRLICDREQMRQQVLGGNGDIANDMYSPLDKIYAKSIPQRKQDIAKAKELLKAAGKENLELELVTRPDAPGMVRAAQVLAEQAKKAGVTVKVRQVTSTDFYAKYGEWNLCQSNWNAMGFWAQTAYMLLPDSPYNDSNFSDPEFASLYNEAITLTDPADRADRAEKMQQIFHERGSLLIAYFPEIIDGYAGRVGGAEGNPVYSFNNYRFQDFWVNS